MASRLQAGAVPGRVGLGEKRDEYPGYLPGGQQRRAAIPRAPAMDRRLMLFDEPTSSLDPELVADVLAVLAKVHRD